jgi:hypothetical protein
VAIQAKTAGLGEDHWVGSVTDRTQFKDLNGTWIKRDAKTGRFMSGKDTPYKSVAKEPDRRRKSK